MQIRFIMKMHNKWKMSFAELRPMISLLNAEAKTIIIEMRLILLAEFKLVKLTMDDDEDHVIDVEILVHEQMEVDEN